MKILYSQIKQLVPGLKASPREIGEFFTMTGLMLDEFEEVKYGGKKDYSIGLEVRQNRSDCSSIVGLAREVAAYYGLKLKLPESKVRLKKEKGLKINVEARKYVKRVPAVMIDGVKNAESPKWLQEFLEFYDMNSKNLLVDLSNYVMIFTGYPSHLLDVNKMNGDLKWSLNKGFEGITTLDGTRIELKEDEELILRDDKNILALAGIVGGKMAELSLNTTTVIAEMALYDTTIVRDNARSLKVFTEASNRLEKYLDPNGTDYALDLLTSLILEYCGGSRLKTFDYYPAKRTVSAISFDFKLPSAIAGIEISEKEVVKILKSLRFEVKKQGSRLLVKPPIDRMDIELEEDIAEEVVRMYGFWKIPVDEVPKLKVVENITPRINYLSEKTRDILAGLGFDEIRSWTLTKRGANKESNYVDWEPVSTQNAVNEGFPELRQSIATGLNFQLEEYLKKNLEYIKVFEIGKVFGKKKGKYLENESLGILGYDTGSSLSEFKSAVETFFRILGVSNVIYSDSKRKPETANPYSCWDITVGGKKLGIIFKMKPKGKGSAYFAEINLDIFSDLLGSIQNDSTVELTQKLVELDANVELSEKDSIERYVEDVKKKIGRNVWSIKIQDAFPVKGKVKYTVRVSYKELSDQEAKKLHLKVFRLK